MEKFIFSKLNSDTYNEINYTEYFVLLSILNMELLSSFSIEISFLLLSIYQSTNVEIFSYRSHILNFLISSQNHYTINIHKRTTFKELINMLIAGNCHLNRY